MTVPLTHARRDEAFLAPTGVDIVPPMTINVIGRFEITDDHGARQVVGTLQRLLLALLTLSAPQWTSRSE